MEQQAGIYSGAGQYVASSILALDRSACSDLASTFLPELVANHFCRLTIGVSTVVSTNYSKYSVETNSNYSCYRHSVFRLTIFFLF